MDKKDIQSLIDYAKIQQAKDEYQYLVPVVKAAFEKALAATEEVLADENALQKEIDAARDALQSAMDSLVKIPVDKSKLQKLVDQSKKYEDAIKEYTPATAEIFKGALDYARDILAKEDATQEEIDAAYAALQNAIFGLRLIPNKDKLDELIQEAEKTDFSKYTEAFGQAVKAALAHAKEVFADENATKEDVKGAEKELKAAINGLKLVSNNENNHKAEIDNAGNEISGDINKKPIQTNDDGNAVIPVTTGMLALLGILFSRKKK